MLHPSIEVREGGIQGLGLFAIAPIPAGTILWRADPVPPRFHIDEINSWPAEKRARFLRHSTQVDTDWHAGFLEGATDSGDYMNHSCDPTAWFEDPFTIAARRDIAPGEEITFDYAMSEIREDFGLNCGCGSTLCRGRITPHDYRIRPELRERYGRHVLPHVMKAAGLDSCLGQQTVYPPRPFPPRGEDR